MTLFRLEHTREECGDCSQALDTVSHLCKSGSDWVSDEGAGASVFGSMLFRFEIFELPLMGSDF